MDERPSTEARRVDRPDYTTVLRTFGSLVMALGVLILGAALLLALYLLYMWVERDPHPTYRNEILSPEEGIRIAAEGARMVFALGIAVVAAGALIRGRRTGPAATVAMAMSAEIASLVGGSAAFETWAGPIFGGALVPLGALFDSWVVRFGAAIAIALGVAAWISQRPTLFGRRVGGLKEPWLVAIALAVVVCAQLARATVSPPTPLEVGKQHLQREYECADKDDLRARCGEVAALALDANGGRLVEVHHHRRYPTGEIMASVWDVPSGRRVWEKVVTHASDHAWERLTVAYSGDARRIAFGGPLDALLPDGATGQTIGPIDPCGGATATAVFAFTPDGQSLAVGGDGVCIRSLVSGAIQRVSDGPVLAIAFSTDASAIWIGRGAVAERWDLTTRERTHVVNARGDTVAVSPDGRRVFALSKDATILSAWDANDGSLLAEMKTFGVRPARMPPRGPLVALADAEHVVALDLTELRVLDPWRSEDLPIPRARDFIDGRLTVSADGNVVAVGAADWLDEAPTLLVLRSDAVIDAGAR
jgi:hypothetical protein